MSKKCEIHLIVWEWKDFTVADDNQSITVEGACDRCGRGFQVTFHEPRYSVLDVDNKGNLSDEWKNYELVGTEVFAN